MGFDRDRRPVGSTDGVAPREGTPGKTTLVEATFGVQMRRAAQDAGAQGPGGDGGPAQDAGASMPAAARGMPL